MGGSRPVVVPSRIVVAIRLGSSVVMVRNHVKGIALQPSSRSQTALSCLRCPASDQLVGPAAPALPKASSQIATNDPTTPQSFLNGPIQISFDLYLDIKRRKVEEPKLLPENVSGCNRETLQHPLATRRCHTNVCLKHACTDPAP